MNLKAHYYYNKFLNFAPLTRAQVIKQWLAKAKPNINSNSKGIGQGKVIGVVKVKRHGVLHKKIERASLKLSTSEQVQQLHSFKSPEINKSRPSRSILDYRPAILTIQWKKH